MSVTRRTEGSGGPIAKPEWGQVRMKAINDLAAVALLVVAGGSFGPPVANAVDEQVFRRDWCVQTYVPSCPGSLIAAEWQARRAGVFFLNQYGATGYVNRRGTDNPPASAKATEDRPGGQFSAVSHSEDSSTYFSMHSSPRNNCPSKTYPQGIRNSRPPPLACVAVTSSARDTDATPDGSLEDVLGGFDDSPPSTIANGRHASTPEALELGGSLSFSSVYNYAHDDPPDAQTDYRGLSRLRAELDLQIDARLPREWKARAGGRVFYDAIYRARGRDEYPDRLVDAYETEVEPTEVYLQGSLCDDLDVKIGRQVVVWGKSDSIRVTDILNPLDRREPGMVDIEDLRLPVGMTRIDYYFGRWNLTGILIHEARFSKRPVFGSEYSPSTPPRPEREPADRFGNTQFAAALSGPLADWDVALYLADVYDDRRHTETSGTPAQRVLRHGRVRMLGSAVNVAKGNWLVKAEAACFDRVRYSTPVDAPKTRYDVLVGLEYRGFSETAISLEAVNRRVGRFDDRMAEPPDRAREDEFQTALRLTRDFLHDRLRVHYLVSLFGVDGNGGGFQRFWAEYDLTDSLGITAGVVDYWSGDRPPFDSIADNDRVFVALRGAF